MRKSLFTALIFSAVAMNLGGCVSLLPKTKPAQLYRFGVDQALPSGGVPNVAAAGPSNIDKIGVVLGHIEFPRASTSDGILTVTGDRTAYIAGARWVAPARLQFQEAVERAFEADAKRTQIINVGDVGAAGAVLRLDVLSFEARYAEVGGPPTIVISLSARLTRSDGKVLDQREFSVSVPADADRISAIVKAFNDGTSKMLSNIVSWTDQEVQPPPPSSPTQSTTTSTTSSSSQTTTEVRH